MEAKRDGRMGQEVEYCLASRRSCVQTPVLLKKSIQDYVNFPRKWAFFSLYNDREETFQSLR
jgi:hypothetical protein